MTRMMAMLASAGVLGGCGAIDRAASGPPPAPAHADWRGIATATDRARLRDWRNAWMAALPAARATHAADVRAEGELFNPDFALAEPLPPAGAYRCRVFKLGAQSPGLPDFTAYPWFECRIDAEGDVLAFRKQTGSQRPIGLLFDDGAARAIFLGTLLLGDEATPLDYGQDARRDMIGYVQRVGPQRWRLVLPNPAFESRLDVIELVPG